ncbi:hypothetical protein GPALN_010350 [Globodera pallida]|nr:hypothetical protein GPALN_010350 [Globodera pallida]
MFGAFYGILLVMCIIAITHSDEPSPPVVKPECMSKLATICKVCERPANGAICAVRAGYRGSKCCAEGFDLLCLCPEGNKAPIVSSEKSASRPMRANGWGATAIELLFIIGFNLFLSRNY